MPMFRHRHMKEMSVENEKNIEAEIAELLSGAGLQLLEFSLGRQKGNVKVKAVIYSPKGTGTDECTKAYRLILPRIQLATSNQNPDIEVASPGIDRLIKTKREWQAFVGNAVKVLEKDQTEWISGILKSADETSVVLENRSGRKTYEYTAIVKARLDSSYKGE